MRRVDWSVDIRDDMDGDINRYGNIRNSVINNSICQHLKGITIGIPDIVSGITILAAGISVPELISSYLLVKKSGLVDMAICNSIGSNIFDILFCLGIPWLLKSIILMFRHGLRGDVLMDTAVPVQSTALPVTSLTLLINILAILFTFKMAKWTLGLGVGIACIVLYVIFIAVSTVLEMVL